MAHFYPPLAGHTYRPSSPPPRVLVELEARRRAQDSFIRFFNRLPPPPPPAPAAGPPAPPAPTSAAAPSAAALTPGAAPTRGGPATAADADTDADATDADATDAVAVGRGGSSVLNVPSCCRMAFAAAFACCSVIDCDCRR